MKKLIVLLFVTIASLMMGCNTTLSDQIEITTRQTSTPFTFSLKDYSPTPQFIYSADLVCGCPRGPLPPPFTYASVMLTFQAPQSFIKTLSATGNTLIKGSFSGSDVTLNNSISLNLKGADQTMLAKLNSGTVDVSKPVFSNNLTEFTIYLNIY